MTALGVMSTRVRRAASYRGLGSALIMLVVYTFLLAPVVIVVGASFDGGGVIAGRAYLNFPPQNLSLHWYLNIPERYFDALWVSVSVAAVAAFGSLAVGVPAALGLVRSRLRGKAIIAALFRVPLQIPFIVIGVAFLQAYYLLFDLLGLGLVGSFVGLALGHLTVGIPYVIGSVGAVLQRFDPSLEEAALSLGASRLRAFRRVTLPIIMPGVYAGGLFAFMVSFVDVPIAIFLAGANYTTLPLEIFNSMAFDFDAPVLAVSTLIVFGSLVLLWIIQRLVGLEALSRSSGG